MSPMPPYGFDFRFSISAFPFSGFGLRVETPKMPPVRKYQEE